MRYFFQILYFLVIMSISISSFAKEDIFSDGILRIVNLGKMIDHENLIPTKMALEEKRFAIVQNIEQSYTLFLPRVSQRPTLDISLSYKLVLQKYALSCEIAALRMVIQSITHKPISEESILSSITIFPGPLSSSGIWSNPDVGFVGSYTGSQRMKTGYGVYEKPLLRYLVGIGLNGLIFHANKGDTSISPEQRLTIALESIARGDRVILWGDYCTTPSFDDGMVKKIDAFVLRFFSISGKNTCDRSSSERVFTWKTHDGVSIDGLSGEHTFLLLGYLGPLVEPTHIIVWDTSTGKHFFKTSEWMRKWQALDYRTLIVRNIPPKR